MDDIELRYQAVQCLLRARLIADDRTAEFLQDLAEHLIDHADELLARTRSSILIHG
jgi:hypothetical protein